MAKLRFILRPSNSRAYITVAVLQMRKQAQKDSLACPQLQDTGPRSEQQETVPSAHILSYLLQVKERWWWRQLLDPSWRMDRVGRGQYEKGTQFRHWEQRQPDTTCTYRNLGSSPSWARPYSDFFRYSERESLASQIKGFPRPAVLFPTEYSVQTLLQTHCWTDELLYLDTLGPGWAWPTIPKRETEEGARACGWASVGDF